MTLEKKLYSSSEVGQIIKECVHDIVQKIGVNNEHSNDQELAIMSDWTNEMLPQIEQLIAEEIFRRHVQGVTFAVWSGPPGSGKGTNIETVNVLGKLYAEVASQGVAYTLSEPFHTMLLNFSVSQTTINTGTKGMFNRPEGEYAELFSEVGLIMESVVSDGGFVPDDIASVLVELMMLYRLTQNFHKIQVDLWPRTKGQFLKFANLLKVIREKGGKVATELVVIKVLDPENLALVKNNPQLYAQRSKEVALSIMSELETEWYKSAVQDSRGQMDQQVRFDTESIALSKVFEVLSQKHTSVEEKVVIEELKTVCDRMAFRFKTVVSAGLTPRPDEFPLSIIRRLSIYTSETSPAFLEAVAEKDPNIPVYIVSSAGTPPEVISEILETLARQGSSDARWVEFKKLAGEVAIDIVNRKKLIVEDLEKRVGGILASV